MFGVSNRDLTLIGAGVAVIALAALWLASRDPARAGSVIGRGAWGIADGAIGGVTKGIGGVFGIPDTDTQSCAAALADGRWWDASFSCPAKDFLRGVFGGASSPARPLELPQHGASGTW